MKYGVIIAVVATFILGGCNPRSPAPTPTPSPAPIESPLNQPPKVMEQVKAATKKGTPRLDALEKRVGAIEAKIKRYEQKYGGQ